MLAWSRPKRSSVPGRKFATTTSARSQRARADSRSSSRRRSSTSERLLRFAALKYVAPPLASNGGPQRRVSSPSGDSIFTTSAPRSPSVWPTSGPASTREKSATRSPSSAAATASGGDAAREDLREHREVDVAARHDAHDLPLAGLASERGGGRERARPLGDHPRALGEQPDRRGDIVERRRPRRVEELRGVLPHARDQRAAARAVDPRRPVLDRG